MNELLVVTPNGYKTSKLYSVVPADGTGDLTWVRNTTATRVNSSGLIESVGANVPRLDYSGGVTCPCILVEPQRTNLLLRSDDFNNAYWTKSATTISNNSTASPTGVVDADTLIENSGTSAHQIFRAITGVTSGATYTVSIFVKQAVGTRNIALRVQDNAFVNGFVIALFNPSTGALISTTLGGFGVITSTTSTLINGFYRFSISFYITGVTAFRCDFLMYNGTTQSYTGDGSSALYIWGAQLEAGTSVSSYIPTVASIQTRNTDVATVTTPAGITSLIETYENGTTNIVNPIPVTYQMSEGRIAKVVGL